MKAIFTAEELTADMIRNQFGKEKIAELAEEAKDQVSLSASEGGKFIKKLTDASKESMVTMAFELMQNMQKGTAADQIGYLLANNMLFAYLGYCLARAQMMESPQN